MLSTIAYGLPFLALRRPLGAAGANALALAVTAIGNTAANRRVTFGIRGRAGLAATVTRYIAMRTWVFAHARQRRRRIAEAARQAV